LGLFNSSVRLSGCTGWTGIVPATGPMCRSLRDVELFTQLVLSAQPHLHDETLYKMPWDGTAGALPTDRKIKIGIMDHDDVVQPHPPMARALQLVRDKLSKMSNVDVVDFKAYKHDLGWDLTSALFFPGGKESFEAYLKGEKLMPLSEFIAGGGNVKNHTFAELIQVLFCWPSRLRRTNCTVATDQAGRLPSSLQRPLHWKRRRCHHLPSLRRCALISTARLVLTTLQVQARLMIRLSTW
jgi:hypothetical protein